MIMLLVHWCSYQMAMKSMSWNCACVRPLLANLVTIITFNSISIYYVHTLNKQCSISLRFYRCMRLTTRLCGILASCTICKVALYVQTLATMHTSYVKFSSCTDHDMYQLYSMYCIYRYTICTNCTLYAICTICIFCTML